MIHTILELTRPLIVLDGETTGLDVKEARFVELGFQVWTAAGLQHEWRSYIDPGIPIPPESTETHHITDSMMQGCRLCGRLPIEHQPVLMHSSLGVAARLSECTEFKPIPKFGQIVGKLVAGFTNCDFAGKNVRYDLRVFAEECARHNVRWTIGDARIVDSDRLEQLGDPRTLSDLVRKHLGEDMTADAHSALGDVQWTTRLIAKQLELYALPRNLDELHALQFPWMIDLGGKFAFDRNGVPRFTQWGKYAGKPMTAADNGYWDFILRETFSADVKAIAGQAKLGNFPKRSK